MTTPVPSVAELGADSAARQQHIVDTLVDAFEPLIANDPRAFVKKFRKMAGEPFAFYRGAACLFYSDVARLEDPWVDGRSNRVWIQGDLHAENYGTYMDSEGILVFDVNDFDEAYLGHYTWDLQRMAASLALLGYRKALSDKTVRAMIEAYGRAYVEQVHKFATTEPDRAFRLTLDNTDGAVHDVLIDARAQTRVAVLDASTVIVEGDRRFKDIPNYRRLDEDEYEEVKSAFDRYVQTIPESRRLRPIAYEVKDIVGSSGFGIGSAGLRAYNFLVEGSTQALENDVILWMKEGQVAAPARAVDDKRVQKAYENEGHRTALSQYALQAHADQWLGWTEMRGTGWVVQELSPYTADLDWDVVSEPDEILPLLGYLGKATAKIHCVSDAASPDELVHWEVEEAIMAVIGERTDAFASDLCEFGMAYGALTRDDHRLFVDAFRNGQIRGVPES